MRFIPIDSLDISDGQLLAKSIYGTRGEVILAAGRPLSKNIIERIKVLGYNGIYIEDEESLGLKITEIISDELKYKTVITLKNLFEAIEKENSKPKSVLPRDNFKKLEKCADELVSEVRSNYDLMINHIDIKTKGDYRYFHAVNVAVLSLAIGIELNLSRQDLYELCLAALLHESGKMLLPKGVLNKPKLSPEEEKLFETHHMKAYKYLRENVAVPVKAYCGIHEYRERFDGSGPLGKKAESIYIFGRIISIANTYDKLTSEKPYSRAKLPSEAMEYIMGGSNTFFDSNIVSVFTRKVAPYPTGTCVMLSNGKIGLVTENFKDCVLRPNVRVLEPGMPVFQEIDLFNKRDLTITGIVAV